MFNFHTQFYIKPSLVCIRAGSWSIMQCSIPLECRRVGGGWRGAPKREIECISSKIKCLNSILCPSYLVIRMPALWGGNSEKKKGNRVIGKSTKKHLKPLKFLPLQNISPMNKICIYVKNVKMGSFTENFIQWILNAGKICWSMYCPTNFLHQSICTNLFLIGISVRSSVKTVCSLNAYLNTRVKMKIFKDIVRNEFWCVFRQIWPLIFSSYFKKPYEPSLNSIFWYLKNTYFLEFIMPSGSLHPNISILSISMVWKNDDNDKRISQYKEYRGSITMLFFSILELLRSVLNH